MDMCVYDEGFARQSTDEQPQMNALYVAGPQWQYPGLHAGSPANGPAPGEWHED